mgnify:CR=1 FL=1
MTTLNRRSLLTGIAGLALGACGREPEGAPADPLAPYRTPYKHPSLVLAATGAPGAFDEAAVDKPFVFRHDGRFLMTYVGFDGEGYQTGLAESDDLLHWRRRGLILGRDPDDPVALHGIGVAFRSLGLLDDATRALARAAARRPESLAIQRALAGTLLDVVRRYPNDPRMWRDVRRQAERIVALDPATVEGWRLLAEAALRTRDSDALIAVAPRLARHDPEGDHRDVARRLLNLGERRFQQWDWRGAVDAWAALAAILVAFLAVPIYTHATRTVVSDPDIDEPGAVVMDASWSTGALSSVHHGLEDNCEACHVDAFVAVRDETCLTCHSGLGNHAEVDRQNIAMPEFTGGEAFLWSVAHAFGKPGPNACTDCHTEHEGAGRMEPTSQQFCSDCHATMDVRLTDTALGNASDFGTLHPQFQALVRPERGAEEIRLSLDNISGDFNGLKFPHDMHLSSTNGVARMAQRLRINAGGAPLECNDCHETGADGVSFMPVEMEESCESCHSLVYDRVGSTFRSLSHGDIEQTQADLMAQDRSPRRPVSTGRRRPGPYAPGGIYYGNFSRVLPMSISRASFADEGLCGECHYPALDGSLAVEPVVQRERQFQHGWFDHDAHGPNAMGTDTEQEACATCHAAETSDAATDFLMPKLESCRDCHMGEGAVEAEVPSSCAMCHSYHPPEGVDSAPRRVASLRE